VKLQSPDQYFFPSIPGWKRVLLADGPRQSINALTLYSFYLVKKGKGPWYYVPKYFEGNSLVTSALTISTFFTVVIFAGSLLLLIVAGICYVPLLCHIQGNLKVFSFSLSSCSLMLKISRNTVVTK
jgi:Fungal potassium channel